MTNKNINEVISLKDNNLKHHPLIVDFDTMSDIDKMKDQIFIDIVKQHIKDSQK